MMKNKVGIKSDTFTIQMGIGSFKQGEILAHPNEVELEVISDPKLTFWDKVKRFFCMDYAYKYEVRIMPPKPRTFLEESAIRTATKHIEMKNVFESFGSKEKEISEKLSGSMGIMSQIKQATEKTRLETPITREEADIRKYPARPDEVIKSQKKRPAKRRKK